MLHNDGMNNIKFKKYYSNITFLNAVNSNYRYWIENIFQAICIIIIIVFVLIILPVLTSQLNSIQIINVFFSIPYLPITIFIIIFLFGAGFPFWRGFISIDQNSVNFRAKSIMSSIYMPLNLIHWNDIKKINYFTKYRYVVFHLKSGQIKSLDITGLLKSDEKQLILILKTVLKDNFTIKND
jgi:hypothetical protein